MAASVTNKVILPCTVQAITENSNITRNSNITENRNVIILLKAVILKLILQDSVI